MMGYSSDIEPHSPTPDEITDPLRATSPPEATSPTPRSNPLHQPLPRPLFRTALLRLGLSFTNHVSNEANYTVDDSTLSTESNLPEIDEWNTSGGNINTDGQGNESDWETTTTSSQISTSTDEAGDAQESVTAVPDRGFCTCRDSDDSLSNATPHAMIPNQNHRAFCKAVVHGIFATLLQERDPESTAPAVSTFVETRICFYQYLRGLQQRLNQEGLSEKQRACLEWNKPLYKTQFCQDMAGPTTWVLQAQVDDTYSKNTVGICDYDDKWHPSSILASSDSSTSNNEDHIVNVAVDVDDVYLLVIHILMPTLVLTLAFYYLFQPLEKDTYGGLKLTWADGLITRLMAFFCAGLRHMIAEGETTVKQILEHGKWSKLEGEVEGCRPVAYIAYRFESPEQAIEDLEDAVGGIRAFRQGLFDNPDGLKIPPTLNLELWLRLQRALNKIRMRVMCKLPRNAQVCRIHQLFVNPDRWGHGVGSLMLKFTCNEIDKKEAWGFAVTLKSGLPLFTKFGFCAVGTVDLAGQKIYCMLRPAKGQSFPRVHKRKITLWVPLDFRLHWSEMGNPMAQLACGLGYAGNGLDGNWMRKLAMSEVTRPTPAEKRMRRERDLQMLRSLTWLELERSRRCKQCKLDRDNQTQF